MLKIASNVENVPAPEVQMEMTMSLLPLAARPLLLVQVPLIGLAALVKLTVNSGRQSPFLKWHMLRFTSPRKIISTAIAAHAARG
jgi:hypothetical protein